MNKVILGLILAVCILGMALVMLNERLGRKTESAPNQAQAERVERPAEAESWQPGPAPAPIEAGRAEAIEIAEARQGLAPPMEENPSARPPALPEARLPEPGASLEPPRLPEAPKPAASVDAAPEKPKPAPTQAEARPKPAEEKPKAAPPPETKPETKPETRPDTKTEKPRAAQPAGRVINRFVVYARDGGATIRVGSPAKINFTNMTLENPDRVVVDMDGAWQFPANPGIPKNEIVSKIRTGKMGEKTRVVIDLKDKPRSVRVIPAKNGDGFDVRVDK